MVSCSLCTSNRALLEQAHLQIERLTHGLELARAETREAIHDAQLLRERIRKLEVLPRVNGKPNGHI